MKKAFSAFMAIVLTFSMCIGAFADTATAADYKSAYANYKDLYENTYVIAYHAYNATLDDFSQKVADANITTVAQFERISEFVAYLTQTKSEFFGDRTTPGKSRYVVPELRDAMTQAYADKQYDNAISYCSELCDAIRARINFFETISAEIDAFDITGTGNTTPTASIEFVADDVYNAYSFGGKIYITNNSDEDIHNWALTFTLDGVTLNSVWGYNGGAVKMNKSSDNKITFEPLNKYQEIYTIPAHGTIALGISCNGDATEGSATQAVFNSAEATISYTVK